MFDGELHLKCLIRQIGFARYSQRIYIYILCSHFIENKPIGLFLSAADELYGPITTLRQENRVVKHVPWSAFKLADNDWRRVVDVRDILKV
jgi:hypothetical protein